MAEKLRDGIGRELRYMEYKFRKRRTDQQKVKKKVKENQYGKNYPTMSEFSSEQLSPDIAEAVPSNTGEEQLQLQVALAMSREDASEQEKAQQSDKIRLELALKESQKAAAVANTSPTHPVNGSVDPWGQPAAKPQNNADLFGGSTTNGFESNAWEVPSSNSNNSLFQAAPPQPANNTWVAPSTGLLPPPMKSPVRQNSPWGAAPAQAPAAVPAPVQATPPDLWGAAPASQPQVDPWGSNQQPPQAPIDPWANMSAAPTAPQPQVDPWGSST
uniref:ENTH domain-containing protein n=1 Tax=Ciona savignyi TaxID=51511 RepID=H2YMM9_CIOSA